MSSARVVTACASRTVETRAEVGILARLLATTLALAALATGTAHAHRFYVSLAEAEFDEASSRLEVALRIDDHNLEDALRLQRGRDYRLTTDAAGERLAEGYVREHFVVTRADGTAARLTWVGWEWSPGIAWLYFEFSLPGGLDGAQLTDTLFIELSDKQVNTVNLKTASGRRTYTFGRSDRTRALTD